MSTSTRWAVLPAALALGFAVTGCSNDGGGGGGGNDLTYEDSPLYSMYDELYGFSEMSQEEAQAESDEQNRKVEELVASCMAEQGFDYIPNTTNSGTVYVGEENSEIDPLEYARQYGYGMTTWEDTPDGQAMAEQDAQTEYVDPNQDTYEAMSESERAAWDAALWGAPQEYDEDADIEEYEYNWEDGGCYGVAQHEVYEVDNPGAAVDQLREDPQYTDLFTAMDNLYQTMQSDPKLTELNSQWSSCMADAGYPDFTTAEDAMMSVNDELNALYEAVPEEAYNDPNFTGPDMTEIKKLEIETATADYTCRDKVDYDDEMLRIQFDLEQQLMDDYSAEIESLLAAVEASRG